MTDGMCCIWHLIVVECLRCECKGEGREDEEAFADGREESK